MVLELFRLRQQGHSAFVFEDVAIHCIKGRDPSHEKREALRRELPPKVFEELVEEPLGRVEFDGGLILVERKGGLIDKATVDHLRALGRLLSILHTAPVATLDAEIFANNLLYATRYCPRRVWDSLCAPLLHKLHGPKTAERLFDALAFAEAGQKHSVCLIHGGLHDRNMLLFGNRLRLIDWSGARIDHPFVDLAQFIVSSALTPDQARVLLDAYAPSATLAELVAFIRLNIVWNLLHMPSHPTYKQSQEIWLCEDPDFGHSLRTAELLV